MFARSVLRSAAPLRQSFRCYATESAPSKSSSTPYIVGAAALGAGVLGYSFLGSNASADAPKPADDAKTTAEGKAKAGPAVSDQPAAKTFTGGEQGFVDLKLKGVEKYNHNTKKLIFELPEDQVSGLNIASAIITKFKPQDAEKPVIRPYTPISDESERGHLDLLIKVYPNGPMSEHLHSMTPGQTLSFKGPIPKYPWQANKHNHVTLIAGGTGITPMYQLTRAIFNNPEDKTKVSLVFGNLTEGDILLKEEFDQLEKDYPQRFRTFYTVDKASDSWPHGKGHVTKDLLKEILPDPSSENIKIFVCGPPGLYKAISGAKPSPQDQGELTGILKELGYAKEQVFKF